MTETQLAILGHPDRLVEAIPGETSDRKLRLLSTACCRRAWVSLLPEARAAIEVMERFVDGRASEAERLAALQALVVAEGGHCSAEPNTSFCAFVNSLNAGTVAVALTMMLGKEMLCDRLTGKAIAGRGSGERPGSRGRTIQSCLEARAQAARVSQRVRMVKHGAARRVWEGFVRTVHRVVDHHYLDWPSDEDFARESAHQIELLHCIFGHPFQPVTADPAWLTSTVTTLARGIYADRAFDRLPILADALQDAGCDHPDVLGHSRDPQLTHARGCWVVDLVLGKE